MMISGQRLFYEAVLTAFLVGQIPVYGKSRSTTVDQGVTPAGPEYMLARVFSDMDWIDQRQESSPIARVKRGLSEKASEAAQFSADLGGAVGRGAERASHIMTDWVSDEAFHDSSNLSPRAKRAMQRLARRSVNVFGGDEERPVATLGENVFPGEQQCPAFTAQLSNVFDHVDVPMPRARRGVIRPFGHDLDESANPPDTATSGGTDDTSPADGRSENNQSSDVVVEENSEETNDFEDFESDIDEYEEEFENSDDDVNESFDENEDDVNDSNNDAQAGS